MRITGSRLGIHAVVALVCVTYSPRTTEAAAPDKVRFESGEILQPVDVGGLPDTEAGNIADPRDTGSYVFDGNQYKDTRLTFDIGVADFRSSNSRYFRAHPVFMECLQLVFSYMSDEEKEIEVKLGFRTKNDIGTSTKVKDDYSRSGCGAEIQYVSGRNDVITIAEAAISQCAPLFASIQRDIGLVIMANSLHIHMTGARDETPYYESDGYASKNSEQFKAWCQQQIDANIDPPTTPDCSEISTLAVGGIYPPNATSDGAVVGKLDQAVTRSSKDFERLAQFPGTTVVFENNERTASWCGKIGNPCQDCRQRIVGNAPKSRCANRLMTYRMYNGLRDLQRLVRTNIASTKLKVVSAFDEARDGRPEGDFPANSLHKEGRMLKVQLSPAGGNDAMATLSKLAVCSRFDYIKRNNDHLILAVKKQKGKYGDLVEFPSSSLLSVEPPFGKMSLYENPDEGDGLPLFDSAVQHSIQLSLYGDTSMFTDPDNRYFRLDPRIAACHQQLEHKQNKWNSKTDKWTKIKILRGYLTKSSQAAAGIHSSDPRFNKHPTGRAAQFTYSPLEELVDAGNVTAAQSQRHALVRLVVEACAPFLDQKDGSAIAVGLYQDGVYMDIREEFGVWIDSAVGVPSEIGKTREDYAAWIRKRYGEAIEGRVIDPDNLEIARKFSNPPSKQSLTYRYEHTEVVKRRRRRDTTAGGNECKPRRDTLFCTSTKKHRDHEVEKVWREVSRKHLYGKGSEIKHALEKCLGNCGTCLTGEVYEEKLENCDNFIHWVPFGVLNDSPNVTNFLARYNLRMRRFACNDGKECLFRSPIFSLLAPSMEAIYRPDPTKSVQEELYSSTDNPLPLYDLMSRLYAIHAKGVVNVYVKGTLELTSMKDTMKVLMVYNSDLTKVQYKVDDPQQVVPVNDLIENWLVDWVTGTYPGHSRDVITPFDVTSVPSGVTKRSAEQYTLSDELLERRRNWEKIWLETGSKIH